MGSILPCLASCVDIVNKEIELHKQDSPKRKKKKTKQNIEKEEMSDEKGSINK